jgi:pyridoxamine 5'-phosphate oxidase
MNIADIRTGFVFFTNLESRKAQHIRENPQVSLLFPWLPLERQVIITGRAAGYLRLNH